jgi:hypothetical protein
MDMAITCVCGLLAGVVLTFFLSVLSSPQDVTGSGITKDNFDLIVVGMTREDVRKIFGCPPGNYTNEVPQIAGGAHLLSPGVRFWIGYGGTVCIGFSADDKVIWKEYGKTYLNPTWFERLKKRILW